MTTPQDDSALDELLPMEVLEGRAREAWDWLLASLLNLDVAIQMGLVLAAFVPALIFGPRLRHVVEGLAGARIKTGLARRLLTAAISLATPLALVAVLAIIRIVLGAIDQPFALIDAAMSLMTAWLVIRAVTLIIRSRFWSKVAFYVAWPVAALDVFGLLDDVVMQLQALAIPLGETEDGEPVDLSLFDVLRTLIYFGVLFWLASLAGRTVNAQLQRADEISPALRALIAKILGFALPVIALLIALQLTGFNLATLAIFSGAVGIGVGLGLQKTVANFAAGFTLLADKSIKPGDALEVDGQFGWVTGMESRYVSLRTRDGTEHLIPNEHFIANGVINWSKSDKVVRQHAPFGVSYDTLDLERVQAIAIEAAKTVPRVVSDKEPVCNLMDFGDSSVNFDLRFWISDPENGLANVRSDVNVAVWKAFHEHGVEFPYPQIDIHVRDMPAGMKKPGATKAD
ncbi:MULTISPECIES: mechanosensitive ion channel family protein [Maricaulis]|jgi:small-conductance mechanosensitive channel|uniref:mechanosensitive ion channel family protein n=1 Tax=Maricaulis TaxID=74317 RepID=UPI000C54DE03|nr:MULTISPECIES: mechanosensitive ion channel domain-containing protein [Maricaulis]MAC88917.1 mechanosensitive ion channel protein MscS [Maricaulis sp.]